MDYRGVVFEQLRFLATGPNSASTEKFLKEERVSAKCCSR